MEVKIKNTYDFLDFVNSLSQKGNIYIVGAGKYGRVLGNFLTKNEILWNGYVDKNVSLEQLDNKKVYLYAKGFNKNDFFIISSSYYAEEMISELETVNVMNENIFVFINIQDIVYDIYESSVEWKKYTKKIQRFQNQYKGQRCFVIGNGPSLTICDLERLKSEITFACNSIYALYGSTFWRPTFYCAWDPIFCKKMMSKEEDIQKLLSGCKAAFTNIVGEGFHYRECDNIKNLFYVRGKYKINQETGIPLFSADCSEQVYTSGTVSYLMLQLAIYMGFQEIYLLGIDASFSVERHKDGKINFNEKENHPKAIAKEDEKFKKDILKDYGHEYIADVDLHMDGYQAARNYAESHGIKIYNATRGGKLEVFERVNFDNLF